MDAKYFQLKIRNQYLESQIDKLKSVINNKLRKSVPTDEYMMGYIKALKEIKNIISEVN